jgi:hypothetical protein
MMQVKATSRFRSSRAERHQAKFLRSAPSETGILELLSTLPLVT